MNSDASLSFNSQHLDALGADVLSIALIGPDEDRRHAAVRALAECQASEIHEFPLYPASLDDVPELLEQHYDVIIIDLDKDFEFALKLVESICANNKTTVMVYSQKTEPELLVRCMHAGAREFLTLPFAQSVLADALGRASARRPAARHLTPKKLGGRLLAFLGAKGGDGVTTLACNFAVSLAQESSESTLLIDLDLPLGDAALNLGIAAEYSTINALQNASRLDSSFLSKLLVKHSSGVSVLAAPGKFPKFDASDEDIDKLIAIARQDFDNVVIDMGSRLDLAGTSLFREGSTIYLVIQAGIAGLRNSNRLISQYFATGIPNLEIVLNRFQQRSMGVGEEEITKALTRPAQWKIPNDFAAVRRMQHTAIPLALEDSPISRLIRQMARAACGLPEISDKEKKTGFSFKKIGQSIAAKISSSEEAPAITQLDLRPGKRAGISRAAAQSAVLAIRPKRSVHSHAAVVPSAAETSVTPAETAAGAGLADAASKALESAWVPGELGKAETRTYKGATYVRGADGKWNLQRTLASGVKKKAPAVTWPTPAPVVHCTALSAVQLNAKASVPGKLVYTPAAGEVLAAGEHTLSVAFTPTDTTAYAAANATVPLTVTKATPAIKWPRPGLIAYGTALSAAQLNAKASVPGELVYVPAAGEVLAAGEHTLSVAFTPADTINYAAVNATAPLIVTKATPTIKWPRPASIAYGTALGAAQLNAKASTRGKFVYTPAAGERLAAGVQSLSATFTPSDTTNYAMVNASVPLIVTRSMPVITWPRPASIAYGTALSAVQLNAKVSIPGELVYTPAEGAVLAAGEQSLSVTFTPADTTNYAEAHATASLTITKATPIIMWPIPAPISHGTILGSDQLSATTLVPGTFDYTPAAGEVLGVGTHTLSVTFTPTDAEDYMALQATVSLTVASATPAPMWTAPQTAALLSAPLLHAEPKHTPVKPAPVQASKAAAKVKHVPTKAREKAKKKPFVETSAKVPAKPPVEASVKVSAVQPVETPARAMVTTLASKSSIDVGPGLDLMGSAVFEDGTTIYLVMQPGSAGLPNSNRMVSQFFTTGGPKPEIVINRLDPHSPDAAEGQSSTALTRRAYSPISRLIGQVVRPVSDLAGQRKGFSLKRIGRSIWTSLFAPEKTPAITHLGLDAGQDSAGTSPGTTQPNGTSNTSGKSVDASSQQREAETRTYKGTTYTRGADGLWHLQKASDHVVRKEMLAAALPMPAPKPRHAPKKASAKATSKRPVKAVKAVSPFPEKETKAAARRTIKVTEKHIEPTAKIPARRRVKAAPKLSVKVPALEFAPKGKKSVSAPSPKAPKPVKHAVKKRVAELLVSQTGLESVVNQSVTESTQLD